MVHDSPRPGGCAASGPCPPLEPGCSSWAGTSKGSRSGVCAVGWVWGTEAQLVPALQAIRTPSRGEAGLELLMAYYNQLCFLDARFIAPTRNLGLLFQW